jgi:hypothetical protein
MTGASEATVLRAGSVDAAGPPDDMLDVVLATGDV